MALLRVFYGWAKLNKTRRREAISVIYENCGGYEKNEKKVKMYQNTVYIRYQTEEEKKDIEFCTRILSEDSIFLDSKEAKGSLEKVLHINFIADSKQVSQEVREEIRDKLRKEFLLNHRNYKEPKAFQTMINF